MKKILMIFAVMAAVLSSCQKSELESVSANDGKDIVLNISVSNPGADTKALIKTGWETDDVISIWYDTNTGETPDLVITYNGTKWIQKEEATVSEKNPSTGEGKYAKVLYNGTVKVASKDPYTYENNTLTFNIANWVFLTEVQVVVKGLTGGSADKYTLACDKFTPITGNGYTVGSDAITASAGTEGAAVTGISNTDGVAFVFATADYSSSSTDKKDFAFTLKDNTSGSEVTKVYKPNVAIEAKTNKSSIKALTITNDKFAKAVPDGFVDLGLTSGIYWAEKNLGASKPEEYGKYFSWGDVTGQTPSGSTFSKSFNWDNDVFGKTFNNVAKTTACPGGVLAQTYDAAYQKDNSWRMPTKEDFTELAKNCFAEWTDSYNGTGVKGVIFWKPKTGDAGWFKPAASDNKGNQINNGGTGYKAAEDHTFNTYDIVLDSYVFFPAADRGSGTELSDAGSYGYYWSSSLCTGTPSTAYDLYITSDKVTLQGNHLRYYGFSVRPVSD